ncbi:MAG: glycosyltransferase, partial [bacterium]|nr:glycosyltransferase [bacterium]
NKGFAAAHNDVIRQCQTPYILVLNQDVFLEKSYCAESLLFLDTHRDVASITGKILQASSLTPLVKTDTIDTCGLRVHKQFHHFFDIARGEPFEAHTDVQEVFGVSGAAGVYRVAALNDVAFSLESTKEYFDESFFMYKEDVDLAYRLRWHGWKAYGIPTALAYHVRTAKSVLLIFNRASNIIARWSYRNHLLFLFKNISVGIFTRYFFFIVAYEFAKFCYLFVREPRAVGAFLEAMKLWKRMLLKRRALFGQRTISDADMIRAMNL